MRILVGNQDRSTADMIRLVLSEDGYSIDVAPSGEETRLLAEVNPYDGIIMELDLGDRHGLTIVQELRRSGCATPVLVYTVDANPASVVRALDAGADAYVVKPVSNDELRAHVRTLVRRGNGGRLSEQVVVGDLQLNRLTRRVTCGVAEVNLTTSELRLLEHLMLHAGEPVTRSELYEKIWNMNFDPHSNVIDAQVSRLRKKLALAGAAAAITTRRGYGFMLSATSSRANTA